jgi:hypothetical protein
MNRYVEELGGVVMLYRNVQLPRSRLGVVFQNRPQVRYTPLVIPPLFHVNIHVLVLGYSVTKVHFKVKVEFLIFSPLVNSTIGISSTNCHSSVKCHLAHLE